MTDKTPVPGTPEWDAMNKRRADLIRNDIDGTLSPEEKDELLYLQKLSLEVVDDNKPLPLTLDWWTNLIVYPFGER